MGSMLASSGRREGGAGGRVRVKESDTEVRGVTTSQGVILKSVSQSNFRSMIETGFVLPFALKIGIRGR